VIVPVPSAAPPGPTPSPCAADLLADARDHERAGCIPEAIMCYESAIAVAEAGGPPRVLAEALRRLAVVRHRQSESARARELLHRSYGVARAIGNHLLAAEARNTLGGLDLATGSLDDARTEFLEALELGGPTPELQARVEQNLGILANIQGALDEALMRYQRSLEAYQRSGDDHGCAIAYHNLGMFSADSERFAEADRYFRESRLLAARTGDGYLEGLCLVNHAEVDVARQRFENAQQSAEAALALFDQLSAPGAKAGAYRVLGMVYRETSRPALAESRLRSAIELAVGAGSVLNEAEACRELAVLYQGMGRNQEALQLLNAAFRLFHRLEARADLIAVGGKVAELEGTYLALVREWGRSIEASDGYTFGHCERVARHALATARVLGLDEQEEKTLLLGAYLHDVGKVRVPHEILAKAGPLTPEERALVERHTVWGVELLAGIEFPWDLKPIIRSHHERYDGSGYPDRLEGEAIPLAAQIVGIWDVYDALTTRRVYQPVLSADQALHAMAEHRVWWSPRVFDAFWRVATESLEEPPHPAP
jgi:putative nucleotidyltransferase with HDIG domain